MANVLTGDFDVVAEFAIPAANRVLAAMHSTERFPHSDSIRVNDNPPPGSKFDAPSITSSVDSVGEPNVNQADMVTPVVSLGPLPTARARFWAPDGVVNMDVAGATVGPVVPSHLQGRAQVQFAAPRIDVPDGSGTRVRLHLKVRARYFPDAHTSPLAEFVRGDVQITAAVNQVACQQLQVIEVDLRNENVEINCVPDFSSQPLTPEDLAGINLLVRNALKTGFLPSNSTLPSDVKMKFKTLLGPPSAVAVLLNVTAGSTAGNPATMNNVFLAAGDHFAFALGIDYIRSAFGQLLNLNQPIPPIPVHHWLWGSTSYAVSLTGASVDLPGGKIDVTITGSASQHKKRFPNFNFTAHLAFTLKATGTTADLTPGDISVDTDSFWVNNFAKDNIVNGIRDARNAALSQKDADGFDAYDKVNRMLSTDENLGKFLNSLLRPPSQPPGVPPLPELKPVLAYTSVEIRPVGIVLHGGWLTVPDPPPVHVEFEEIPATGGGTGIGGAATGGLFSEGPDYSALKAWIPGGTIQQYEWNSQGQLQPYTDVNKFVLIHPPPEVSGALAYTGPVSGTIPTTVFGGGATTGVVSGFVPICLTVRGSRLSSSGPVVDEPVSATVCGHSSFPLVNGLSLSLNGELPLLALTRPGAGGLLEVVGHTPARLHEPGSGAPNLLVHFADDKTASSLEFLLQALRATKRPDAITAVLAVLTPQQLGKTRYAQGVVYAQDGPAWERVFQVEARHRPLTLIASPTGKIVWRHEGELQIEQLTAALQKNLSRGGFIRMGVLRSRLRVGRGAPNFLFECAPGHELTMRKLAGRKLTLVFWKSLSQASIEAVRELQKTADQGQEKGAIVLAVNDGEPAELAKRAAAENRLSTTLVTDPKREIALAYDVNMWPTIVLIDEFGLVRGIRYGRPAEKSVEPGPRQKAGASR